MKLFRSSADACVGLGPLVVIAIAVLLIWAVWSTAHGHESWINRGGYHNRTGEFCCGALDCFVIPHEMVQETRNGYVVIFGPTIGAGPAYHELVPFAEAQPSPDGEFWRCKRPDGTRRCFFAPPPNS